MTMKISLFGRKKKIIELTNNLEEKEKYIKSLEEKINNLANINEEILSKMHKLKYSNEIANEFNNFVSKETYDKNNSFFVNYSNFFDGLLNQLDKKEYKTFLEHLLFEKGDVDKKNKSMFLIDCIKKFINIYDQNIYSIPIYYSNNLNDENVWETKESKKIFNGNFNFKERIELSKKDKFFIEEYNKFTTIFKNYLNLINNTPNINDDEINDIKRQTLNYVAEFIFQYLISHNETESINYLKTINNMVPNFDLEGYLNWESNSKLLSYKTFRKSLVKTSWSLINDKNNFCSNNFSISYPVDYEKYIKLYGKQKIIGIKISNVCNYLIKSSANELIPFSKDEYYSWIIDNKRSAYFKMWNDCLYLTKEELIDFISNENYFLVKIYNISFDFKNIDFNDLDSVWNIIVNSNNKINVVLFNRDFILKQIMFYFVYKKMHS